MHFFGWLFVGGLVALFLNARANDCLLSWLSNPRARRAVDDVAFILECLGVFGICVGFVGFVVLLVLYGWAPLL